MDNLSSTLWKAAFIVIFTLIAFLLIMGLFKHEIDIIELTFRRDVKFLWRYANTMVRSKWWECNNCTVAELFTKRASKHPGAPCFYVVKDKTWTFREMADNSNRVARVMQDRLDLKRGEVVCLFMPNCAEYVYTWLGMAKVGAVSALIDSNLRTCSLLHYIQVVNAKAIIFSEPLAIAIAEIRDQLPPDMKLFQMYGDCASGVIDLCAEMCRHSSDYPVIADKPQYRDTLFYIYTSETNGKPKAAILPNAKYLFIAAATVHMLGLQSSDCVYNPLPLYQAMGGLVGTGAALVAGIPSVIPKRFCATNNWIFCRKYKCTVVLSISEMCRYLFPTFLTKIDPHHNVRIRVGNGMNHATYHKTDLNPDLNDLYDMTEGNAYTIDVENVHQCTGAVGFLSKLVPARLHPIALVRVNKAGEIKRESKGFCVPCPPYEPGMLISQIAQGDASREYYGYVDKGDSNEKIVRNVFRKGDTAYVSGDIFEADMLGNLLFRFRFGDTFKWKGKTVSNAAVEDVVRAALPGRDCVVYGVTIRRVEGHPGMVAVAQVGDFEEEARLLASSFDHALPSYARPLFLRFVHRNSYEPSMKFNKFKFQLEGCDTREYMDSIFFRSGPDFVPLTFDLYDKIDAVIVKL